MFKELLEIKSPVIHTARAEGVYPPSYKQFARELGYGLLCNLFIIYIPFDPPHEEHPDAFKHASASMRHTFGEYLDMGLTLFDSQPEARSILESAVPFGISENGHFLFWDITKSDEQGEHPVYIADFPVGIYYAGNGLVEMIRNVTGADTFKSVLTFNTAPLQATFEPYAEIIY